MGRIKTQLVKRITKQLIKLHGEDFKDNFNDNKTLVSKYTTIQSKKIRNTVAGYATRIIKSKPD